MEIFYIYIFTYYHKMMYWILNDAFVFYSYTIDLHKVC